MGRPKLPPQEKRDESYLVKVNDEERQRAQRLSARTGRPVAELYREGLLLMEREAEKPR